jgi:hypothetical protein
MITANLSVVFIFDKSVTQYKRVANFQALPDIGHSVMTPIGTVEIADIMHDIDKEGSPIKIHLSNVKPNEKEDYDYYTTTMSKSDVWTESFNG